MKSVLICCDLFPPAFGPRMGYLCKYLLLNGWKPVVITEDVGENTFSFLADQLIAKQVEVKYIRYYTHTGWLGKMEWGFTFLRDILFGYKDNRFYREALKKIEIHDFNLILCSTYRTFPMRAAARLAQNKNLPLVIDLRDIIEQYAGNEFITHPLPKIAGFDQWIAALFRKRNLTIRNKILRQANGVTTISSWHVSVLKTYNPNTRLIYNGYDPELFFPSDVKSTQFYVTYTGRLLSTAMRDPDLLFQAVQKLLEEEVITPDLFRIRWFVDEKSKRIITHESAKYPNIKPFMEYFGYIPASEIPLILQESAILVLLTNKASNSGPQGVMTTKLFEALAVGKPILSVRGDEGCIEEVITRTCSGLSAHTADEAYQFIKSHYLRWKEGQHTEDNANWDEIKKFSRDSQAQQFIEVFLGCISE